MLDYVHANYFLNNNNIRLTVYLVFLFKLLLLKKCGSVTLTLQYLRAVFYIHNSRRIHELFWCSYTTRYLEQCNDNVYVFAIIQRQVVSTTLVDLFSRVPTYRLTDRKQTLFILLQALIYYIVNRHTLDNCSSSKHNIQLPACKYKITYS